jgi:Flp pilus assembly protein TadD
MAEILIEGGATAQAIALLEPAPPYADLLNALAVAYAGAARYRDAEAALRRSLALDSESPGPWLNLGVALEAQGRKSAAADS